MDEVRNAARPGRRQRWSRHQGTAFHSGSDRSFPATSAPDDRVSRHVHTGAPDPTVARVRRDAWNRETGTRSRGWQAAVLVPRADSMWNLPPEDAGRGNPEGCLLPLHRAESRAGSEVLADHPRTVNLREAVVASIVNGWIGRLFAQENGDATVAEVLGSQEGARHRTGGTRRSSGSRRLRRSWRGSRTRSRRVWILRRWSR